MKITLAIAGALFCALALAPAAAFAQHVIDPSVVFAPSLVDPAPAPGATFTQFVPDGRVAFNWGDFVAQLIDALGVALVGVALVLFRKLPSGVVSALDGLAGMLTQQRADALLEKAVNYGINVTKGAVAGKTLTVEVGNEVLERAAEYAIDKAPMFVQFILGIVNLRGMIVARLNLEEEASLPAKRSVAETLVVERVSPPPAPAPAPAP